MTKNEFKQGDKVTLADVTTAVGIIRYMGKETCVVDFGMGDSTVGYKDIVPLDRRTAFLTELQELLRKYDAEICYREGDCELHINLGSGNTFDRISCPFEYSDYDINDVGRLSLTAENIMDFNKE